MNGTIVDPHGYTSPSSQPRDESFYAEQRQRREEAIARGEDPYADFKAKVDEKRHVPLAEKLWNKPPGKSEQPGKEGSNTKE
jgi:hypothetical protein